VNLDLTCLHSRLEATDPPNFPFLPPSVIKDWPGVCAPFPDVFDPFGLAEKAGIEDVRRWRESEIVHGKPSSWLASAIKAISELLWKYLISC
jgi:light-harvesting complex I chlorophyll a/b binding protein 1